MKNLSLIPLRNIKITSGFWNRVERLVRERVIPYQWDILNDRVPDAAPSHCIKNFRIAAGEEEGEFYGRIFQDSDLAKWLEAVAYSLMSKPDPELEALADDAIALIERAQQADGYLNTYFTVAEPGNRWKNLRDCHELYCAGHMMEAAVAYYEATGKRVLLDGMTRMAYHIDSVLGPEHGKLRGYPGHEVIELALIRMYHATNDPLMLKLARYFIDERGQEPHFFEREKAARAGKGPYASAQGEPRWKETYWQTHLPVREQKTVEGHSVRALYLTTGMADVARETGDEELFDACKRLFDNLAERRMYITGGAGSTYEGEAFTLDYDLPNDTVYAETCASIALCFFARSMLQIDPDAKYAEAMERALFNTCLAGMSLDGKTFFYVNPLEVHPESCAKDPGKKKVLPVRPKWFDCACCPPNLARLILSLGKYLYTQDGDTLYIHTYIGGETRFAGHTLHMSTNYPYEGSVKIGLTQGDYGLRLRIPNFTRKHWTITLNGKALSCKVEKGYAVLDGGWQDGDCLELTMDLSIRRVYANPRVREDIGKVAFMRGPLVYCAEEVDNGSLLGVGVRRDSKFEAVWKPDKLGGIVELRGVGYRIRVDSCPELYRETPPEWEEIPLTLIPYFTWANRGENEMTVYLRDI